MSETPEEKARRIGVPLIPKRQEPWEKYPFNTNPVISVCGQCGLELHRVMGYCCRRANCPTGLGGATS